MIRLFSFLIGSFSPCRETELNTTKTINITDENKIDLLINITIGKIKLFLIFSLNLGYTLSKACNADLLIFQAASKYRLKI